MNLKKKVFYILYVFFILLFFWINTKTFSF